jgi:hypothetical protein
MNAFAAMPIAERLNPVAVPMLQGRCSGDTEQRHRRAADEHPPAQPRLNVAECAVTETAECLEDRAVRDVRSDRDAGVEAEDQHEDRRHQRAAPHAGDADERTNEEAGEAQLPGHCAATAAASSSAPLPSVLQ